MDARLVNISRTGALVATDWQPPDAMPVSVRIESPVRTDWADAMIVRVDPNQRLGCTSLRAVRTTYSWRAQSASTLPLWFAAGQI